MNNLLSYCGLVDARIRGFDKDLPVQKILGVSIPFMIFHIFVVPSAMVNGNLNKILWIML